MKKAILIAVLMCSTLAAYAVRYRTTTQWIASSTQNYPECNEKWEIVEMEEPYMPGVWTVVSMRVIDTTCDDPCSNCMPVD